MLLTVKALQGRECSLEVPPEERVGALKVLVAERLQVPVEQQRLLYRGKALADERRLCDYAIGPSARLNLVLKPGGRGGGGAGTPPEEPGDPPSPHPPALPLPRFRGGPGAAAGAPFRGAGGGAGAAAAAEGLRAGPAGAEPGRPGAVGGPAAAPRGGAPRGPPVAGGGGGTPPTPSPPPTRDPQPLPPPPQNKNRGGTILPGTFASGFGGKTGRVWGVVRPRALIGRWEGRGVARESGRGGVSAAQQPRGPLRLAALAASAGLAWLLLALLLGPPRAPPPLQRLLARPESPPTAAPRPPRFKCGLPRRCPPAHFAFRLLSGAANVVGPRICLEGRLLMSSAQNNVGRGLNIALVNGVSGELIAAQAFDMWAGDAEELLRFLRPLHEGTLVLVASYDDPATKLTEETRRIFAELGSVAAKELAFRDSWVFLGAKGVQDKSPFEQHVRNSRGSNKYEGWPEALEMEGCVPRRGPDPR